MPRRRQQCSGKPTTADDLAFPVPIREQAKYLDLANCFLALENSRNGHKVVAIDRSHRFPMEKWKWKKAS